MNDDVILSKLSKQKVDQLDLINMNDNKINNINGFSNEEREVLQRKLKEYHLKINKVEYSRKLTSFFSANKAEGLLNKLRERKAKEAMIPKLTRPRIKDFDFLSE